MSSSGYTPSPASPHATDEPGRVIELMQIAIGVQYDLTNHNPIGAEQLDVIYNKCRNRVYGTNFDPTASMSRSGTTSHRFSPTTVTPTSPPRPRSTASSAPPSPTPSRTSVASSSSYVARDVKAEELEQWEDETLKSGAHSGVRFGIVRSGDRRYCAFIVQKYQSGGLREPSLIEFARYLILMDQRQGDASFMAIHGEGLPEDSMLAVIDTGCNNTCHGSRWFDSYQKMMNLDIPLEQTTGNYLGVGGKIKVKGQRRIPVVFQLKDGGEGHGTIVSTELEESDAPLLLSTRAQRALGLTIDLGDHDEDVNIYSKTMNGDLEVINRGGLPALRLLPGEHREGDYVFHSDVNETPVYVDTEEESTNDGDSPKAEIEEEDTLGYLSLEECSIKAMTKGQKKKLQQSLETVEKEDAALWSTLRSEKPIKPGASRRLLSRGCGTFLMEIFAGAATLTWMAASWGLPVSEPIDCLYNYDLLKPAHRAEVERRIQAEDPFLLSLAPICGPWSTMQRINLARGGETQAKILEDRKKWYPVIQWIVNLIKDRLGKGREVILESPYYGLLWELKCIDDLMAENPENALTGEHLELMHIDQCQYGLRDPSTGLALQKATGLLTASEWMKLRLQRRCGKDHQHRPIEGSNISKTAEQWPPELCEQILGGALDEMIYGNLNMAFPAELEVEEHQEQGPLDGVFNPDDLAPIPKRRRTDDPDFVMEEKMQEDATMADMPDVAMKQEEHRRQNWLKLPREKRLALRRLHNMTGHCSHAAMTRMLKASGSDRDVIQAVKFFQCQVCAETAKEEKANVTKPPRPAHQQRFNFEVSADVFEVHDAAGARHSVLSLVDVATKFHVAGRVGGGGVPSSRICAQMINTTWLSWAGAPDYFVCDQGVHNRGKVAHLLEAHGTTIRQTAARAPFQLGVGERHGGLLKEIMKRVIHERQLQGADDIAALCSEAAKVKNSLLNHAGYTPSQWVMGFMPEDKTSIFSCDFDENMGVHQNLVSMEEDERGPQDVFQKQLLLRQFAKQAYMEADSCQKIRKSLLRKSVPMRGPYQPGDLVSFLKKDRWLGPARVLANEGRSSLWLVHNGVTVLVAETACRPATSQEILKKHVLELRPSRKRKRMLYLDELDDDPMPFDEDLVTAQNLRDPGQSPYADLQEDDSGRTVAPRLGAPGPSDSLQGGLFQHGGLPIPPGLPAQAVGPPPGLDLPEEMDGDPEVSSPVAGQHQQEVPTVAQPSPPEPEVTPATSTSAVAAGHTPLPAGEPTTTSLSQALRRSPDLLDGHFSRGSQNRSMYSFLANRSENKKRKVKKKPQKAGAGRELNFEKEDDAVKKELIQARIKEWNNWVKYTDVKAISKDELEKLKKDNPTLKVIPTRWVDVNKSEIDEEPRYKSRLVVRGDLENATSMRTDSPTASTTMLNCVFALSACKRTDRKSVV